MSLEWSDGEEELLIDFFAKHESLHNKHHADYNFNRKNKLLAELVKELNHRSGGGKRFKVDMVSKHWNELRNLYNQHKRKIIKNELTGNKNAQTEPDWIWWKKINNIFTGVSVADKSNESDMGLMSNTVHHQSDDIHVLSPARSNRSRAEPSVADILNVNVNNAKRRTTIGLSPRHVPPTKVYQRRTIHPPSLNNEVKVMPLSCDDDSETEFECEVNVIPIAVDRKSLAITKPFITSTTEELINSTSRGVRRKVNMQSTVTSMKDTEDTSVPKSANDECASTAMFVESRLRTYDDFKRQRMIFKIHELFYQEDS